MDRNAPKITKRCGKKRLSLDKNSPRKTLRIINTTDVKRIPKIYCLSPRNSISPLLFQWIIRGVLGSGNFTRTVKIPRVSEKRLKIRRVNKILFLRINKDGILLKP